METVVMVQVYSKSAVDLMSTSLQHTW